MKLNFIVNTLVALTVAEAKLIMLIRHGEKIDDNHTDLSPQGQARAECLVEAFGQNGVYTSPQKIFAQSPTEQRQSTRPRDTVAPLAESLNLQVDLQYTSGKYKKLAKYLKTAPEEVILVAWGNDRIPNIANELGIANAPNWKGKIFDDVWILTDGKTPYVQNPNANVTPSRSLKGSLGLDMVIVKENVEQCMSKRLESLQNAQNESQLNSSGEMIKTSGFMTLASLLIALLYLFY